MWFLWLLTYGAMFWGCVALGLIMLAYRFRHLQDRFLYFPQSPAGSTRFCDSPKDFGIDKAERLEIKASDGVTIRGWIMYPSAGEPLATLLYLHGNAGNVGHRLPIAAMLLKALRIAVVMVDYRGYGLSDAVPPTESGLRRDAEAMVDHLYDSGRVVGRKLIVMGTSLGGAVAIQLAKLPRYSSRMMGLIVENSFTSISDMADVVFTPIIRHAVPRCAGVVVAILKRLIKPLVLFIGWESIEAVKEVTVPVLFLTGLKDQLVPPAQLKALYENAIAAPLRKLVEFPTGTHNDLPLMEGYCSALHDFISSLGRR